MAELQQKTTEAKTDFQKTTSFKKQDTASAIGAKAVVDTAVGLGKDAASRAGRNAAAEFSGVEDTLRETNTEIDLFDQTNQEAIAAAKNLTEGPIGLREEAEIRDEQLRSANLSAKGLQGAIDRGLISPLEATARANLEVQRRSNSLLGTLFQNEFRTAFGGVTGNPAGSPAMKFNKNPAQVKAEALAKAKLEGQAETAKKVSARASEDGTTDEVAATKMRIEAAEAKLVEGQKVFDAKNLRNDKSKLDGLPVVFNVEASKIVTQVNQLAASQDGLLPVNKSAIVAQIRAARNEVLNTLIASGTGFETMKSANERADQWEKDQIAYVELRSRKTLETETQEILKAATANMTFGAMPIIMAISASNPELAKSLALMDPAKRLEVLTHLGYNADELADLTKMVENMRTTFNPDVRNTSASVKNVPENLSINSGDTNNKIVKKYIENGGDVSDLNQAWMDSTEASLIVIRDSLAGHIETGDKDMTELGVNIINKTSDKFDFVNNQWGVKGEVSVVKEKRGHRTDARIHFPENTPEENQQQLRVLYSALKNTPSLWEDDFFDVADIFTAIINQGYRLPAGGPEGKKTRDKRRGNLQDRALKAAARTKVLAQNSKDPEAPALSADDIEQQIIDQLNADQSQAPVASPDPTPTPDNKAPDAVTSPLREDKRGKGRVLSPNPEPSQGKGDFERAKAEVVAGGEPSATKLLQKDEGYTVKEPANVPVLGKKNESGITIAGLDLAKGNQDVIFEILRSSLPEETVVKLEAIKDLTGKEAQKALKPLLKEIKLSRDDIARFPDEYLKSVVDPMIEGYIGDKFASMPESVKQPLRALNFLLPGPNTTKAIAKALETGDKKDLEKALAELDVNKYFDKAADRTPHNKGRVDRVAKALKKEIGE